MKRFSELLQSGSFYHGLAPSHSFEMLPCSSFATHFISNHFVIKSGITPSIALQEAREGLCFLGSGEICQLALYEAIKKVIGVAKFNTIFSYASTSPFQIGFDSNLVTQHALRVKQSFDPLGPLLEKGKRLKLPPHTGWEK